MPSPKLTAGHPIPASVLRGCPPRSGTLALFEIPRFRSYRPGLAGPNWLCFSSAPSFLSQKRGNWVCSAKWPCRGFPCTPLFVCCSVDGDLACPIQHQSVPLECAAVQCCSLSIVPGPVPASSRIRMARPTRVHFTIVHRFPIERLRHCHFDWRPTAETEKSLRDNAARRVLAQISPLQPTFGGLPVEMTGLRGLPTRTHRTQPTMAQREGN